MAAPKLSVDQLADVARQNQAVLRAVKRKSRDLNGMPTSYRLSAPT